MRTREDITRILRDNKCSLLAKYPIKELALFGSYSNNTQGMTSDIDIMVNFLHPIGVEFIDLADDLEKLLEAKVDLVSKNGVKAKYLMAIEADLIYV